MREQADNDDKTEPTEESPPADDRTPERKALEAKASLMPTMRHASIGLGFAQATTGFEGLEWKDAVDQYRDVTDAAAQGSMTLSSHLLMSQALTLDTTFTEMMRRATANLNHYPDAVERFMRLALKAQAQSRATIEALAKMHQPREQTVKHVHIDNRGGQAVVTDTVVNGGRKSDHAEQSYGPDSSSPIGPAMLGQDETWHGVPVPGDEEPEAVPDPRRQGRGTEG